MFSPGDAEQLLADAVGHFQIVGQLGIGQLALVGRPRCASGVDAIA